MTIQMNKDAGKLSIALTGRLDTLTAPELESALQENLGDVSELTLDLAGLAYISSAGLRVLLTAQKRMNKQGSMTLCNVNETVMEVFTITGFCDILHIV
jgi:anti-sigma B factor antagonist